MNKLLSLKDAARKGIVRLRQTIWAGKMDHVKIASIDGALGPWVHLYSPFNLECNGRDPVDMLAYQVNADDAIFVPYDGPLPDSEEYKAEQARYAGCLKEEIPS